MSEPKPTPSGDIQIDGDLVQGNKFGGDEVAGDKFVVAGDYVAAAEMPPIWVNVPAKRKYFVGRGALMQGLMEQMTGGQSFALSAEGKPGVGKTTLAVELAQHPDLLAYFKDGVLWGGLGRQADVMSILTAWADALGVDVANIVGEQGRKRAVRTAIGQRRLLLVIDDAWDGEAAMLLQCGGPNCCHLLTTRNKGIARQFAKQSHIQTVPTLDEAPAFSLLQALAAEACAAEPQMAKKLAQAVGGLPLALELLGGYLAVPERSLFPELSQAALDELRDPRRRLRLAQARLGGLGQMESLQETMTLSLDDLQQTAVGAAAVEVFYRLGAFAPKPDSFSRDAALTVAATEMSMLALLAGRNLIEIGADGAVALHQTLADVARTKLEEATTSQHRVYYLGLVNADRNDWQAIQAIYGQLKWAWQQAPEDETILTFVYATFSYQSRRGLWHDAIAWVNQSLRMAEGLDRKKEIGSFLTHLGFIYNNLGQRDKALKFYNRALPIMEDVGDRFGESISRWWIALLHQREGLLIESLNEFRQAAKLAEYVQSPYLKQIRAALAQVEAELDAAL